MDLTAAVEALRARIAATGRDPESVRIVAMTKGFGVDAVAAAVAAGLLDCGENYAQALLAKVDDAPAATRWHFLGAVQRNKVRALAPHVHVWQSIDRDAAVAAVATHAPGAQVLVQVNLAGDPARPGCDWEDTPRLADVVRSAGLDLRGLMGVASPDRDAARTQFRRLAALAARLGVTELSIGMTGDLEVALEEGATTVRVGTALFGARPGTSPARR